MLNTQLENKESAAEVKVMDATHSLYQISAKACSFVRVVIALWDQESNEREWLSVRVRVKSKILVAYERTSHVHHRGHAEPRGAN